MNKGFTLTEIMVVTAIIVLLSLIIFPNYASRRKYHTLQRSASKLAQDIRRAQEMAMSARDFGKPGDPKTASKGGYGVYLNITDSEKYILFADCNKNCGYDAVNGAGDCASSQGQTVYAGCVPEEVGFNVYPEKFGADIEFEKGVEISILSPIDAEDSLNITFTPPDPTTRVNGLTSNNAQITLRLKAYPDTTITINVVPTGLIYIE